VLPRRAAKLAIPLLTSITSVVRCCLWCACSPGYRLVRLRSSTGPFFDATSRPMG